jgi:hypothetical protein
MADRGNPIFAGGGGRPVPTTAAALPSNLLQMEDRAIIVIGGKQVAAGEVKRQILQSLPVSSTPPKRMSVPPRRAMPQLPSVSATTASASEPSSMLQRASGSLTDKRLDAANFDCSHGPTSVGLHSAIRAGEQIAVTGACFGSQPGAIELIGQFPGGSLRLTFLSWKDSEIIAAAPPVKGVPDQVAAFTIVRADGKRSTTRQVNFVAARERVEVPSSFWSPSNRLTWSAVGHDTLPDLPGPFLNGYPSTDFRLRINPACTLDAMETNSTMGEVIAITGWDGGSSPFEANVRVAWMSSTEKTTTKTTYLLGATSISELFVRRVDFTVRAWAYCPAGIVP